MDATQLAKKRNEVQTKIDEEAPVHATVTVIAPVDMPIEVTIEITPDTAAIRAAVEAELDDLATRTAEPGATVFLSSIYTAIGNTPDVTDYIVTTPAGNVFPTENQLASFTVTWI